VCVDVRKRRKRVFVVVCVCVDECREQRSQGADTLGFNITGLMTHLLS
jgi:hypothetical protein